MEESTTYLHQCPHLQEGQAGMEGMMVVIHSDTILGGSWNVDHLDVSAGLIGGFDGVDLAAWEGSALPSNAAKLRRFPSDINS